MDGETKPPKGSAPLARKLATILCADIAGYSQKMGADEERTVQVFRGHREVFESLVNLHQGRIFNTAGDALLAEFNSAVEAVRCATEIQSALSTRNAHLPPKERLQFRIGINVGDVIVQDEDLLGDGVNVAARIQATTEPGGICISGSVFDQIQNKLSLNFKPLGEKTYKNIAKPVRTYTITESATVAKPGKRLSWKVPAAIAAAVLIAGAGYWGYQQITAKRAEQTRIESQSAAQLAAQKQAAKEAERASDAKSDAQLQAQKKAAEDALRRAQEERIRLDQDRKRLEAEKQAIEQAQRATEDAKRDAQLQAQKQAAEDALRRVQEERNRLEQDRKRLEAERQAAESAKKQAVEQAQRAATKAAEPAATAAPKGAAQYDGVYKGRFCSLDQNKAQFCWAVPLTVRGGVAEASYLRPTKQTATVKGTVGADGAVELKLSSWTPKGDPISTVLTGRVSGDTIAVSGQWPDGPPISGNWTRAQTVAETPAVTAPRKSAAQYDGAYKGRFCSLDESKAQHCWAVSLTIRSGVAEASWLTPAKKTATVKGTVAADGAVELKLSTWSRKGDPISAVLAGRVTGDAIAASGQWRDGTPISGNWTRAQ